MWKYYAVLSAVFAAATAIFAKLGLKNVDSNLATAIRTTVILMLAWSVVLIGGLPVSLALKSGNSIAVF